jgi:glycosyltransferase involved in cell wall biosynthesis
MLPFLNKKIRTIELLHNFTYGKKGMEFFGLANHKYLSNRIIYDNLTSNNIKHQYREYEIPNLYDKRILFIEPGVDLPTGLIQKQNELPLKVLYAGRGGVQKRVWLIDKIAQHFYTNNLPVIFHFAGTMENDLTDYVLEKSILYGKIANKEKMKTVYSNADAIILTSQYEGFPMVIKEAMAYGSIPIVTALEGNKTHLINGKNALLIEAINEEDDVIKGGIEKIMILLNNPVLKNQLSENCAMYAKSNFSKSIFNSSYYNLLIKNE